MSIRSLLLAGLSSWQLAAAQSASATPVPVGVSIQSCTLEGVVAITFDDGPYIYTEALLDQLAVAGIPATFFLNGNNWANIMDHAPTVQRMVAEGHQVASHTYSHPDMATLNQTAITSEMTRLEDNFIEIIGQYPVYMRPPYFSFNNPTLRVLGQLGYKVIHADIDTLDWQNNTPETTNLSLELFEAGLQNGGSIALMHDVHQNTVENLVPLIINSILGSNLRAVTVGECLGDAQANWYRASRPAKRVRSAEHAFKHSRYISRRSL
ncbi:hypothetical protein FZEAL_4091 [Fusarium zealandicum]|uniref:NodB homology domain-containing protein n=1 Tax=Fusarium zealandicum TaxID=1053134 RepID=A0A8H4UN67_9HYPO|nr:hypothetical protein FZEAL_4091 [Fusarium zealandicum]